MNIILAILFLVGISYFALYLIFTVGFGLVVQSWAAIIIGIAVNIVSNVMMTRMAKNLQN